MDKVNENSIADLKHYYSKCRDEIMNLLGDGESSIKSIIIVIDEKVWSFDLSTAREGFYTVFTSIRTHVFSFFFLIINQSICASNLLQSSFFIPCFIF